MLKIFSRLKIQSGLRRINNKDAGFVDIDDFYSAKFANKNDGEKLKEYLKQQFGADYLKKYYQDGVSNLTLNYEKYLYTLKSMNKRYFGNGMVGCLTKQYQLPNGHKIMSLQFDEPKSPPTKILVIEPEDLSELK